MIRYNKKKIIDEHNPTNLRISNKFTSKTLKWRSIYSNKKIINKIIDTNET